MIKRFGTACVFYMMMLPAFAAFNVAKWQPHDFEFKSNTLTDNPFMVTLSADFTGPNGAHLTLPGFYDGNGIWKVRFSATTEGKWLLVTHSTLSELNDQKVQFTCIANTDKNSTGPLLTDTQNPHHIIYPDGTHWFPLGYECNWLWAMDENNEKLPAMNLFLDKIQAYGFNYVLINTYCYDTSWRPGKLDKDDYGPSALYPWNGTNTTPDFTRFNVSYWHHFDHMMDALYKRGIVAHIYLKVYNKKVNWPINNSPEDDRYYKWIIARYAAYPNLIWDLAKEANYEKSVPYKVARLKFIRTADPYHHLLTVHTDIQTYDSGAYDNLIDLRSHQEQSDHLHATALKQLASNAWPVFNVESGYEFGPNGPNDKTYAHAESAEEVALRVWQIQMAGAYNAYYYTYTAWDIIRPNDTPPGYNYMLLFKNFFSGTKYWLLKPADSLVNNGYCLANTAKEYVVFEDKAAPFTLNLTQAEKPMKAQWYQPYTGKYEDAGMLKKGIASLTPPASFSIGLVVLKVEVSEK